jgi:hypothetical protein
MLYDALAEKYLKNNSSEKGDNKNWKVAKLLSY